MTRVLKNAAKNLLKSMHLYGPYLAARRGPLKDDGWFRSLEADASVDAQGNPLPWITYPAIDFLKKRIHPDMSVFEYGCGGSTLWWASRVKEIVSVEHSREWHEKMKRLAPSNVTLYHIELVDDGAYSRKVAEFDAAFDIVVIDGRDRVRCGINSLKALKPAGVIIWDNSDRQAYEQGIRFLLERGFHRVEFIGLAPLINIKSETSILFRNDNCLGI